MYYNASIVFDHRGRVKNDGFGTVEIRITISRKAFYVNTGIRVLKRNFVGGTVVGQADAQQLNERLAIIFSKVQDELNRIIEAGEEPNAAEIKRRAWQAVEMATPESSALLEFIEEQEGIMNLKEGTLKHYRTLRTRLRQYGKLTGWRDVSAENICKFDAWLHRLPKVQSDVERKSGEPVKFVSDSGCYNYHKCLKAILSRAVLFGKIDYNPYEQLRGKFKRGDKDSVDFLTVDEMNAIESLHPVEGTLMAAARDLFVFQLHTGLAYADTQAFNIKEYKVIDGKWVNIGHRVKTGIQYITRLSDECLRILGKYGMELPKISNSDYNKCLKALGAAVGIEKPLHSHLARHSFATKMTASGAAIQNVSKMLGHASVVQTQRYAKVLPESVFAEFKRIEEMEGKTEL